MKSRFNLSTARNQWFPIAASSDLVYRHVYHAQLLGRELAVWRADDGHVNVWENRCLHRGVRLSIGINDGTELVCQYHGWRYANRTAGCTYIPAHPADSPARTICNRQYPVHERDGLIWSIDSSGFDSAQDSLPVVGPEPVNETEHSTLVLRAIPVNASIDTVRDCLQSCEFSTPPGRVAHTSNAEPLTLLSPVEPCRLSSKTELAVGTLQLDLFLQPLDSERTVIRGLLSAQGELGLSLQGPDCDGADSVRWLKTCNRTLSNARDRAELMAAELERQAPWQVSIIPVSESQARLPALNSTPATHQVVVSEIVDETEDIKKLVLQPLDVLRDTDRPANRPARSQASPGSERLLPTFQPGAHIDVHLQNGITRQYSLTNSPGQTGSYVIGVKRDPESSGGSSYLHQNVKAGDVLAVSAPRNNFPLRRDAVKTLFIAGGIGVTPLLSMASALHHNALAFELHYFVRDKNQVAFADSLRSLDSGVGSITVHDGLSAIETVSTLQQLLSDYQPAHHVYFCGPEPMLQAGRDLAEKNSWPQEAVHFEYFKNHLAVDDSRSFTVSLARSGLTLQVPAGTTLLQVLRENGVDLPSSCEQGACGTCKVDVINGEPLHQDVYLNETERQRGDCMMTCVSRAITDSLTLDI